jgi:predicted Rossmann fold flavoprotein
MSKRVAIVGAGASGLVCAIFCARKGLKVDIYEQNNKPAKKILVSGNGRCNISNKNLRVQDYFSDNPEFVNYALESFGFEQFRKFCTEIGLLLNILEDGRAYPLSNEAKSVAKIFEEYALTLGVVFHNATKITKIKKLYETYDAVVVATGSRAGEHLGGNNDGEAFAQEFGHKIIPPYPSLVQLHLKSSIAPKMSGTKLNAELTLLINAQKEQSIEGDILFTAYGISGFAVLDISQAASQALMQQQSVDISVNLLPMFSMQKLAQHISSFSASQPTLSILDILVGLLPLKIANGVLEELSILNTTQVKNIHIKLAKKIANKILNWKFEVTDTHGFRHAEVSGGGVDTKEIHSKTMMSKKAPNLYFCGEVVDILGKRGGYNFAWAWASGYLAAQNIAK